MSEGYSPLRRWLRQERAGDHESWLSAEKCPHCGTRDVTTVQPRWGEEAWRCVEGHRWEASGYRTAQWLFGSTTGEGVLFPP